MARAVSPVDLFALVAFDGRVYPNEARPRECLGAAPPAQRPLETALEQWFSFATGRHAWISASGKRLHALVGARPRGARRAWEIDLLVQAGEGGDSVLGLLDCASGDAARSGVEKLFLRLPGESPLLPTVQRAGFQPYAAEELYVGSMRTAATGGVSLRPLARQDAYPAYRLYLSLSPEVRRQREGATFGEWQAAQERRWLRNGVQLGLERNGALTGLVRAAALPQGTAIDLLLQPDEAPLAAAVIASAHAAAGGHEPLLVLCPRSDLRLAEELGRLGLEPMESYVSLVARTTAVERVRRLVPAAAKSLA
jgi:hypothetical protein